MVKNYHDYLFYDENKQIRHFISINAINNLITTLKICFFCSKLIRTDLKNIKRGVLIFIIRDSVSMYKNVQFYYSIITIEMNGKKQTTPSFYLCVIIRNMLLLILTIMAIIKFIQSVFDLIIFTENCIHLFTFTFKQNRTMYTISFYLYFCYLLF